PRMPRYRVTVDTGGTFSDFVYLNEETGEVTIAKVPSTPHDPSRAILAGIELSLAKGARPADISYFCHGTTVGTNALLEGKGVRGIDLDEMPSINISLSSEVMPQIREYHRLSTTVINAYLAPILACYIAQLDRRMTDAGIATRQKYIMQSNGGMATFAAAARKAVTTVLSGPAGGVTAGAYACRMTGFQNIITFDMGGTSCDVALIRDGEPFVASRGKIEGRDLA